MRNYIYLSAWNRIHFPQQLGRQLAHHNESIGKLCDLFEYGTLTWVRLAQHRVQRGHKRHLQFAQQGQDVATCSAAIDAVFMLQAN